MRTRLVEDHDSHSGEGVFEMRFLTLASTLAVVLSFLLINDAPQALSPEQASSIKGSIFNRLCQDFGDNCDGEHFIGSCSPTGLCLTCTKISGTAQDQHISYCYFSSGDSCTEDSSKPDCGYKWFASCNSNDVCCNMQFSLEACDDGFSGWCSIDRENRDCS